MYRRPAGLVLAATLLFSCENATTPAGSPAVPSSTTAGASPTPVTTAAPAIVLHWMSFSGFSEPRYRLLYEGGEGTPFSQLRLVSRDGAVVASGAATSSASEALRMCGGGTRGGTTTFGPLRATLIIPTQAMLADIIQRPDAYRVEVLIDATWRPARVIEECHVQSDPGPGGPTGGG